MKKVLTSRFFCCHYNNTATKRDTQMLIYHDFDNLPDAEAKLAELRAVGMLAYLLTMNDTFHQVREIH